MLEKNKIILTGSNGQLGKELVSLLIQKGYDVIGIDLSHNSEDIEGYLKIDLDITQESQVQDFYRNLNHKDKISGLVNNAGIAIFTPLEERTYEEIRTVMDVNIAGTILMTKYFMESTKQLGSKISIVNLGSIYGAIAPDLSIYEDTPRASSEIYGMTKASIINFTQYLASYYKDTNARFNCVSPGGIEFEQGPIFKKKYSAKVPLGRMAKTKEISEVIYFLLSEKSSYINGENIFVDGGLTKW